MVEPMRKRVPHSEPRLDVRDERAILRVLRSGQLGGGAEVEGFERRLERATGAGRFTAVHTGSAALHLALLALGVRPGDRVLLPSYVCAAVLNAVRYCGAEEILADVDPSTGLLDPDDARRRLRARTAAMVVPHLFGRPAAVRELLRAGVPLVEDCAMALGADIGREGSISTYSFYATKMIATGHGGAVATRDRRLLARIRDLVQYDNRDDYRVRHNYRMSALGAALGASQLSRLPEFVKRRRRIAEYYYRTLGLGPLPDGHVFYRVILRVGPVERCVRLLAARGVECKRPVYRPLHRCLGRPRGDFPGAEELHRSWASLPVYPGLRDADRALVARAALDSRR
jgi:perosamine synthetase